MVFCSKCGTSVSEGSKFCLECGAQLTADAGQVSSSQDEEERKKKGGGFFSSPAGIALVVVFSALLIAGIVVGAVLLTRSGSDSDVDGATVQVWDEYESMLDDNSANVPQITMDPKALAQIQADLKKTQDRVTALEKVLEETGGTNARKTGTGRSTSTQDIKADQMAAALAAYNLYIQKMNELFGALVGANLLDQNVVNKLNQILAELQKLGADVKVLSNKFLQDNTKVVTTEIDPPILKIAEVAATKLQENVTAAQNTEKQRLDAEKAAADQAAAAAEAERQRQQQNQLVTCPNCGGVGTVEGGDGRYTCGFCNGTGTVTRSKAATYNPSDWRDY